MKHIAKLILVCLVSCILSSSLAVSVGASDSTHFYFAQITDTHLGAKDELAQTVKVVEAINKVPEKLECVVLTGDITQKGNFSDPDTKRGLDALKEIKVPLHFVPGNHDVSNEAGYPATPEEYQKCLGPLVYKVEHAGVVFLTLCTESLYGRMTISGYDPIKWLETALAEVGNKPVIIFGHIPPTTDTWNHANPDSKPQETRAKLESLLKSHNVKAVICGHYHRDELEWIGDIPLFIAAPVAAQYDIQTTYRIYEYTDGKLAYWSTRIK